LGLKKSNEVITKDGSQSGLYKEKVIGLFQRIARTSRQMPNLCCRSRWGV